MPSKKLTAYQQKRHFTKTPEPQAHIKKTTTKEPLFVVQQHASRSNHYDFRIEHDGVLLSWAIPKGFSLNPAVKHLAVQTEDHPYDYAHFEGTIPAGEYGAGTVMVWDIGTYENRKTEDNKIVPLSECLKRGIIEITLKGKKLRGGFALVKLKGNDKQWIILKMNDKFAQRLHNTLPRTWNKSALTQRTMAQIKKDTALSTETDPCYGKKCFDITSPDKILFPNDNITKQDLINYYEHVAPYMLPYMKNRPLTMQRFPDGITTEGFYHKDVPEYFPAWVTRVPIQTLDNKTVHYAVCNNIATLAYLANAACITPHLFLSTCKNLQNPDQMIFDLDPSKDNDFASVKKVALLLKKILENIGLVPFVKTTGSRGLHVIVPLKAEYSYDEVRKVAHRIAELVTQYDPQSATIEVRKASRNGKVFIDTLRNSFGATVVAPYAVRALPEAPVAMLLFWEDLDSRSLRSTTYTIHNVFKRLDEKGDAWKGMRRSARSLQKALKLLAT